MLPAEAGAPSSDFEGFDFNSAGTSTFGDIFESIFGNFGAGPSQDRRRGKRAEPGEDLHYAITLSFLDAAKGIETPIQISHKEICPVCQGQGVEPASSQIVCPLCQGKGRIQKQTGFMKFGTVCTRCGGSGFLPGPPCRQCHGEGRVGKVSRLKVRIPAGVDSGSKVRIAQKGNAGRNGGPPGDLIITIAITPHKFFQRSGPHIELTLPVTYAEAALGTKLEIPTLDGHSLFKIPPGTVSGQKLRLKGKGIVNPKSNLYGDMIIEIKIVPPATKDLKVRELLKEIEKISPYDPRRGSVPMKEKTYFISAVASKYNIHPQTLRLYEREGLLIPSRSKGNTRMYTDVDLKKLEFILNLTREMGVNLAGIEIVMNMKVKMETMQEEFISFLEELKKEFFSGREEIFEQKKIAIVKFSSPPITAFRDAQKKK